MSLRHADYNQRCMGAAHRRYRFTLEALALVRKLAVPALQINLARERVNVAASSKAE